MSVSSPVELVLGALRASGREPRPQGAGWTCRCPAHDDRTPSLSVGIGDHGGAVVHCHAGCPVEAVVAALGLSLRDLMNGDAQAPLPTAVNGRARGATARAPATPDPVFPTAAAAVAELERRQRGARSAMWTYTSASGEPVGVVVRFDGAGGKVYRPASRTEAGWTLRGMTPPRLLYRLPDLDGEPRVWVVEGEKCADAAAGIGLIATTSAHGAGSAAKTDWTPLAGRQVVILPDHDGAGEGYAQEVAELLLALSAPAEVRVVRLPDLTGDGDDLADFIAARGAAGRSADEIRREVEALAAAAEPAASVASVGPVPGGSAEFWPEPRPLPDPLPPVLPFDPDLLPAALRPWVVDIAERIQCPIDFPAVAAMVALAAIVGRKLGIRPKRYDDWTVVPNLWGGVIGRPGVMKTPALQEPIKPLKALEMRAKAEFDALSREREADRRVADARKKSSEGEIRKAVKKDRAEARRIAMESLEEEDAPEPVRRRYLVNDSSVEKLGEILNENPSGVLVYRDELIGLLKGLEKEGQESARSFYLEAWNGTNRFTYDRIGRGTVDIEAAIVSIIGGIQPGPLLQYLRTAVKEGSGDDGLMQRFQLLVWPDLSPEWINVDRWPDSQARKTAYELFEGLDGLDPDLLGADTDPHEPGGIPFYRFSPDAQEVFDRWRAGLEGQIRSGELHPVLESHLAKYRSLIPSLALLVHLADEGRGPVGIEALERAIRWGVYLESHARRVYAHAAHPDLAAARALAKKITAGDLDDGFALRDVYRAGWSGLSTPEDAKGAADLLADLDWLREVRRATDGRTATAYRISPRVLAHTPKEGADRTDRRGGLGASVSSVSAPPGDGPELHGPDDDADGGVGVRP